MASPESLKSHGVFLLFNERIEEANMEKKIYVGNLPFKAKEEDIRDLFSKSGEVESVKIITDINTGAPRGFGFVEMATKEDAQKAIQALNGSMFMDRKLTVNEAKPRPPREKRGGTSGGGRQGGGFGRKKDTGKSWR